MAKTLAEIAAEMRAQAAVKPYAYVRRRLSRGLLVSLAHLDGAWVLMASRRLVYPGDAEITTLRRVFDVPEETLADRLSADWQDGPREVVLRWGRRNRFLEQAG